MPMIQDYVASVTVSVELRAVGSGKDQTVTTYSVTRVAKGTTHSAADRSTRGGGASGTIERAVVDAVAAEKALRAGAENAEARRLK